nr:MAG: hypothetical protein [Bacteriophage sp.]
MNDFYSKLRQRLYSDAKVVNYYAKEMKTAVLQAETLLDRMQGEGE